jgi:AcrR family transcriptional regulator
LVREGFDRASTNRIAEVAGVSVGSLYQYYPGKEALVAAVIDRHNGGNHVGRPCGAAGGRLAAGRGSSAQACYRSDRGACIDPKLHRVLAEQIPRTGGLENVEAFNRETYALNRAHLERHSNELRTTDLGLAAFVCVTSIEALAYTAVLHHSKTRSDEVVGTLVDEVTRLVVGYLQ